MQAIARRRTAIAQPLDSATVPGTIAETGAAAALQFARSSMQNARCEDGQAEERTWTSFLIDDEVSLRRTLRTTLESMGHAAAEARRANRR